MARARNIKPGFFSNEILADCKPLTRLLFAGLWTISDREGRLEDRPRKIKAEILPYDNCNADDLLNELASKTDCDGSPAFIIRYKSGNKGYIEIINFTQHQNPHMKEAASTIPAPDLHNANTVQEPVKNGSSHADSLLPITDSLLPITTPKGEGVKPRKPFKTIEQEERFDQYWKIYPKKKSKGDAEKAWGNINPDDLLFKKIINNVEAGRLSNEWTKDNGEFIPYPATWLNRKGWDDEYTQGAPKTKPAFKENKEYTETLNPAATMRGVKFYTGED